VEGERSKSIVGDPVAAFGQGEGVVLGRQRQTKSSKMLKNTVMIFGGARSEAGGRKLVAEVESLC